MELWTRQCLLDKATRTAAKTVKGKLGRELVLEHPLAHLPNHDGLKLDTRWFLTSESLFKGLERYLIVSAPVERFENEHDFVSIEAVARHVGY